MTAVLNDSYQYCTSLARRAGSNFYWPFLTLPRNTFRDMCVLYAFMRISDDLGDDEDIAISERRGRLARWRTQLQSTLAGQPADHPVFPALAGIVTRYQIPHEPLIAVVDGVAMDLEPGGFDTFDELSTYCYHVAGAVGVCCIHVWGFHDDRALQRAVDCGCAFQLTNILRDLAEDADRGRVYLPQEDFDRFHYTAEDLAAHRNDGRFQELMRFECRRAWEFYERATELYDWLEPTGVPVLSAMLGIYGGLLRKIERRRYDVFSARVALSKPTKMWIMAQAWARRRITTS